MQVFFRNTPFNATEEDMLLALARYVHRPPIQQSDQPLLNFHVELFYKGRSRRSNKGCGIIIFTTADIARAFLRSVAIQPISLHHRVMTFQESNRSPDPARIEALKNNPWVDPEVTKAERQRAADNSAAIPLQKFSFGRLCRDDTFSPEREGHGSVSCDVVQRKLVVTVDDKAPSTTNTSSSSPISGSSSFSDLLSIINSIDFGSVDLDPPVTSFSIGVHRVAVIAVPENYSNSYQVFVEIDLAPTFRRSCSDLVFADRTNVQRLSSYKPGELLPPILRMICLTFQSKKDLDIFVGRSRVVHLPRPIMRNIRVAARNVYSPGNVSRLEELMKELEFSLSFELDKAF